jgi:hypothetical protein
MCEMIHYHQLHSGKNGTTKYSSAVKIKEQKKGNWYLTIYIQ